MGRGLRGAGRLAAAAALAACAGCVERELRVETDPPGAELWIDGSRVGTTPWKQPFTFYGARRLTVRLDGYTPHESVVPLRPPWFQVIPLDFFFELLWPGTLRDDRTVTVTLQPLVEEEPAALIERARAWRSEAQKPGPEAK